MPSLRWEMGVFQKFGSQNDMTGFFYDVRNYFGAKFSGRFLSVMLRELGRHEPESFVELLLTPELQKNSHQITG